MNKTIAVFITLLLLLCLDTHAAKWLLVDYGKDAASNTFGTRFPTWNQVIAGDPTYMNPDGLPLHDGISADSFCGIKGTSPINLQMGYKVVVTFFNTTNIPREIRARISFKDEDSYGDADWDNPWYGMYDESKDNLREHPLIAGNSLGRLIFNIADSTSILAPQQVPTVGDHYCINVNYNSPSYFVITRIELTDQADTIPPEKVDDLQATMISMSTGAGNCVVQLSWSEPADPPGTGGYYSGVHRYHIYRNGEFYAVLNDLWDQYWGTSPKWHDLSAAPGTRYEYSVVAVDRARYGWYLLPGSNRRGLGNESEPSDPVVVNTPAFDSPDLVNPYQEFEYKGAFKMPGQSNGSDWEWINNWHVAFTCYPDGNPGHNPSSELPGSIYGIGRTRTNMVSETTIPVPVIDGNPDNLPVAGTIKPFADIIYPVYEDKIKEYYGATTQNRGGVSYQGLAFHPGKNGVGTGLYQGTTIKDYTPNLLDAGHMWFNLAMNQTNGPWHLGGLPGTALKCSLDLCSKVIFEIPQQWADAHASGRSLVYGRTRVSGAGERAAGPSLFAAAPWDGDSLPGEGGVAPVTTLLRYDKKGGPQSVPRHLINFNYMTGFAGGAWLSSGGKSAVVFSGRRSLGEDWYGWSTGVSTGANDYDLPKTSVDSNYYGGRGPHATDNTGCLYFYNPADLEKVAAGTMEIWDPQPYMIFDIRDRMYRTQTTRESQAGDIAYDRERGYIYIMESRAAADRSVMHVWKVQADYTTAVKDPGLHNSKTGAVVEVYPNPFSTSLNIQVRLEIADFKLPINKIGIYDITGRLVFTFGRGGVLTKDANNLRTPPLQRQIGNSYSWDAENYPAGIYIVKVKAGSKVLTRRITLIK
jgi:hypothetical protein